jgi:DNA-binding NarL/FixJ family response regulator
MITALAYRPAEIQKSAEAWMPGLSDLVEAIGKEDFGSQMLTFFDNSFGADHCAVYQLLKYELTEIASVGADIPLLIAETHLSPYEVKRRFRQFGQSRPRVERYKLTNSPNSRFSSSVAPQGIMIIGSKMDAQYCVRILRLAQQVELSDSDLAHLQDAAHLIISLVARHQDLSISKPNPLPELTSLKKIEERILSTKCLSRREGEVCARILCGYSSCGIALDLGIGKESVMTYRKRAYQHLGIGSQRELLLWYLEQATEVIDN